MNTRRHVRLLTGAASLALSLTMLSLLCPPDPPADPLAGEVGALWLAALHRTDELRREQRNALPDSAHWRKLDGEVAAVLAQARRDVLAAYRRHGRRFPGQ